MKIGFFILLVGIFSISCGEQAPEMTNEQKIQATVEAKLAHDSMEATVIAEYSKALTATAVPENSPTIALDSTEQKVEVTVVPIPTALPEPAPVKSELSDFEKHMEDGIKFREYDQFDQALKEFTAALDIDPKSADTFFQRGMAHSYRTKPDDLGSGPNALQEIRDYDDRFKFAISDFTEAIAIDSSVPEYWYERGLIRTKIDYDHDEFAIGDFGEAIELDPDNPEYYFQRGKSYVSFAYIPSPAGSFVMDRVTHEAKICEKGLDDLNKAIHIDPREGKFFIERINAFECQRGTIGDYWEDNDQTRKIIRNQLVDFESAIKTDPQKSETYFLRAKFYERQNMDMLVPPNYVCPRWGCLPEWEVSYPLQVSDYSRAIAYDDGTDPRKLESYYSNRGSIYYAMFKAGDMDEDLPVKALSDSKKSRELGGNGISFNSELEMAIETKDCDYAKDLIDRKGWFEKPEEPDGLPEFQAPISFWRDPLVGRYYACIGDWPKALATFESAGWMEKSNPGYRTEYAILLAQARYELGLYKEALAVLEIILPIWEEKIDMPEAEAAAAKGFTRYEPNYTNSLALSLLCLAQLGYSLDEERITVLDKLGYDTASLLKQIEKITSKN